MGKTWNIKNVATDLDKHLSIFAITHNEQKQAVIKKAVARYTSFVEKDDLSEGGVSPQKSSGVGVNTNRLVKEQRAKEGWGK